MLHATPPNGGYGWCVVAASFFVHVFVLGNVYSFGVFYPQYLDAFNSTKGVMAWVGSISVGLMGGLGAWTGKFADRHGNNYGIALGAALIGLGYLSASFSTEVWHLYLTHGVVTGVGYSFAFIAGVSVVGQWFTTKRGLAIGIAVAGSGVGQFVMSLVTNTLLTRFGWRITLRVLAATNFVALTLCALVIRRFVPLVTSTDGESWFHFFRDHRFTAIFWAVFLNSLGLYMPYTYLPLYAQKYGVSSSSSVLILSLVGLSSAAGRIIMGYFSDKLGKLLSLKLCMFGAGAATLCWMACTTFPSILVYGLFFGFFAGGTLSLMPTVSAELFGLHKLGAIVGMLFTGGAAGSLLSAPIGGFLFDFTHGYTASIAVAGSFLMLGSVVLFPLAQGASHASAIHPKEGTEKGSQLSGELEEGVELVPMESATVDLCAADDGMVLEELV